MMIRDSGLLLLGPPCTMVASSSQRRTSATIVLLNFTFKESQTTARCAEHAATLPQFFHTSASRNLLSLSYCRKGDIEDLYHRTNVQTLIRIKMQQSS